MLHASTSPFYPLFAALDVNAKIHEGESGRRLWAECVELGIESRKAILARCKLFRPFIPPVVDGKLWQDYPTSVLASDRRFFSFEPGAKWHGFEGYAADQYFVDPCKLLLTTPGINAETGEYSDFGVPATILAHYLRENGIVPEKCDLNSILFLLTPAESHEKLAQLVAMLAQFEQHIEDDSPLAEVLPSVYNKYPVRYRDYTMRQLCQEMHDLYVSFDVKDLQKAMFRQQSFPSVVMNPRMRIALIFAVKWSWCGFVMPKGELRQKGRCLIHWRALRGTRGSLGWGGSTLFPCTGRRGEFVAGIFAGAARCL